MPNRDGSGPVWNQQRNGNRRGRGLGPCGGGKAFRGAGRWQDSPPAEQPAEPSRAWLSQRLEQLRQEMHAIEEQLGDE